MTLHAITVLGRDRPGIIAETTGRLAWLGLNLEDSTMTLLRGHFAMMLVCEGATPDADIEAALAPLTADGSLTVTVREVPTEAVAPCRRHVVDPVGARRRPPRHRVRRRRGDRRRRGQHHRPDDAARRRPLPPRRPGRPPRGRRRRGGGARPDGLLFLDRTAGAHAVYARRTYL